jgi:hypothetical protein
LFIKIDERILPGSVVFIAVMSQFYDNNNEFGLEEGPSIIERYSSPTAKAAANVPFRLRLQHSTFY